jgi:hypothetical protein
MLAHFERTLGWQKWLERTVRETQAVSASADSSPVALMLSPTIMASLFGQTRS